MANAGTLETGEADPQTAALQRSQEIQETVLAHYDDPAEREAVRNIMKDLEGIDVELGLPVETETKTETEAEAKDDLPEMGETEAKAETEAKPDDELARLRAELADRDRRLAEFEAEKAVAAQEDEIRQKASTAVAETARQFQESEKAAEAKLAEYRENYGEEAARELAEQIKTTQQLQREKLQQEFHAEADKLRAESRETATTVTTLEADIRQHPDLAKWAAEAKEYAAGDTAKSSYAYELAVVEDNRLRATAEWKDKPQADRFGEVVKRVKTLLDGTAGSGSPDAGKQTDQSADKQQEADGLPSTMSDLKGGAAPDNADPLKRLADMDIVDIHNLHWDTAKLDVVAAEQLERL